MENIKNTIQIKGDFTDPNIQKKLKILLSKKLMLLCLIWL